MDGLLTLRIDTPPFLIAIDIIAAALALFLLLRPPRRRLLAGAAVATGAGLLGWLMVWLADDVYSLFGVGFTPVTIFWIVLGFAGVGLALANVFRSRWWRLAVGIVSIPVFVMTAAAGVNVDFGAYRTLNDVVGVVPYTALDTHAERGEVLHVGTDYASTTVPGQSVPAVGEVGTVHIPATTSHFPARIAVVYLPPVALSASPPVLPVLYAFSGQPGAPSDMFTAGRIAQAMDSFAAVHDGYAPIVVAADQLGAPGRNPMCVDSRAYGNSERYLLTDVREWVSSHFRVSSDPAAWGVFGYSQGGTCAVQYATGHPELFGSALASSSELGPTLGDRALTIDTGFGGSASAFAAAQPLTVMAAHSPYKDSTIVFGVGQNDAKYMVFARTLAAAAQARGIHAELLVSPGSAHDWNTVRHTLRAGFPAIAKHMGLEQ